MDSKAYFEKVMQDFNQFRNGRSVSIQPLFCLFEH